GQLVEAWRRYRVGERAGGVAAADNTVRSGRHAAGYQTPQPAVEDIPPRGFAKLSAEMVLPGPQKAEITERGPPVLAGRSRVVHRPSREPRAVGLDPCRGGFAASEGGQGLHDHRCVVRRTVAYLRARTGYCDKGFVVNCIRHRAAPVIGLDAALK